MSSILSDNLIEGTPEENFAMSILAYTKTFSEAAWEEIVKYVESNFTQNDRKLCWKKYSYIAISKSKRVFNYRNGNMEDDNVHRLIIASELINKDEWGRGKCNVFRYIGKVGPKDRRGQWYECNRSQENPVLASGWQFSDYKIYRIPLDMANFLFDFLPKAPKKK